MKTETKAELGKLLWHLLMMVCLAVYAMGLVLVCEAAARVEFRTFKLFLETEVGRLAMKNAAVLAFTLMLALYFLVRRIWAAMALVSVPMLVCHMINAFKLNLRNEPFFPWDITLAGEATNILGDISLEPSKAMILAVGCIAAAIVIAAILDRLVLRRNRPGRLVSLSCFAAAAAGFAILWGSWMSQSYIQAHTIPLRVYNQHWSYKENGFLYTFVANIYHAQVPEPEGYSAQTLRELTADYCGSEGSVEPNVIVVMSEAFSDLWNAENLTFDQELAPNFMALAGQYLSGNCMTSEYGGNTANCEFEVLTGYSTWMMPNGTVMYMSYLNQPTDSYVSYVKSRDYYAVAVHPYQRSFFSREKAFELLGFDEFYSAEAFQGTERLRVAQYVSDLDVADRIIEEFEKNQQTDRGFFCHTVTMLNHTSYYNGDWPEEERVGMQADCELTDTEYAVLVSYATGLRHADSMLGKLVDYFSQVEEPTVILFFGDHQPSLGTPGYELMQRIGYVADNTSLEGILALQSTPYLIWNNFEETPTAARMDMSMFHLLPYMTRTLDLPRPAFHSYMDGLFEMTRGVTRQVSLDGNGTPVLTLEGEAKEAFEKYLCIVYDGLMGKQYGNAALYGES